ncbi:FHA domain-containing protein [Bifidobacterium sp. ESL0790]|uniref:FHA domain-containing protein n=1 Tax=Bifidobacterium sp. ESL0790 TaxID=2983233 RepID=UPI0023F76DED|nr:FHA domain-containing protein [Bifidobacterium sp. ESL0790]WEV73155.1 FHA domain-containing protein [Bifidobacterium sp. ESL0790]
MVQEAVAATPVEKPAPVTAESQVSSKASNKANNGNEGGASAGPAVNAAGDIEDWDGTVLSSSFMGKSPNKGYHLHNDATGQDILLDRSTLLGRHVSATVPEGAVSVKLTDPTRTVSRNHAAISFDKDGTLWIEDYGSLNGTYVIEGDHEKQIKGKPMQLSVPSTLRIGDQFFKLTE